MKRHIVDKESLPDQFPTHAHSAEFWEHLGRAVGTFGALEEVLGRAIFALTGTRPYDGEEPEVAVSEWEDALTRALTDTLQRLINTFGRAVRDHPESTIENLDELLESLSNAARLRNVLCHGSWQVPDREGKSVPRFAHRSHGIFTSPVDIAFLIETRNHVAELICEVMNVVTHMGFQFPGSGGPGRPVW